MTNFYLLDGVRISNRDLIRKAQANGWQRMGGSRWTASGAAQCLRRDGHIVEEKSFAYASIDPSAQ